MQEIHLNPFNQNEYNIRSFCAFAGTVRRWKVCTPPSRELPSSAVRVICHFIGCTNAPTEEKCRLMPTHVPNYKWALDVLLIQFGRSSRIDFELGHLFAETFSVKTTHNFEWWPTILDGFKFSMTSARTTPTALANACACCAPIFPEETM